MAVASKVCWVKNLVVFSNILGVSATPSSKKDQYLNKFLLSIKQAPSKSSNFEDPMVYSN